MADRLHCRRVQAGPGSPLWMALQCHDDNVVFIAKLCDRFVEMSYGTFQLFPRRTRAIRGACAKEPLWYVSC